MYDSARKELMKKIQELGFAAVDLNLYLDNHPTNQQALMDYNRVSQELSACKRRYEAEFGPLNNFGLSTSQYPWKWINEPWPWEEQE